MVAFAAGMASTALLMPHELPLKNINNGIATARIDDIKYTDKSMSMQLTLVDIMANNGQHIDPQAAKMLLSTRGSDFKVMPGDIVMFPSRLERIRNLGNPDEMDYAGAMKAKGFLYTQHLENVSKLKIVGRRHNVFTRMAQWRIELETKLLDSSLKPNTQKLVIAILLGNDDLLDKGLRENFSTAGLAHLLALSGLHVGIIASIIWFLFFPLDYLMARRLRLALTLVVLLAYDVLTGFSPSVARATVMMFFLFVPKLFYRKSVPLNSLCVAAVAILAVSPGSLRSVGFQLSFITVAAILLSQHALASLNRFKRWQTYTLSLIATSLIASLATAVLTAHYFNTISLVSAQTNCLVLPLFPLLLFMCFAAVVVLLLNGDVGWLGKALDIGFDLLDKIVDGANAIPFGHFDNVWVSTGGIVLFYLLLILLSYWVGTRRHKALIAAILTLAVWVAHSAALDYALPENGLIVFNSFGDTPVLYYRGHKAWLWTPDVETTDVKEFRARHKNFLAHHEIDSVCVADSVHNTAPGAVFSQNAAQIMNIKIVAAGRGIGKRTTTEKRLETDWLIITKRYHGTIEKLNEIFRYNSLMLSGDLYIDDEQRLIDESKANNINVRNIKRNGAVVVSF